MKIVTKAQDRVVDSRSFAPFLCRPSTDNDVVGDPSVRTFVEANTQGFAKESAFETGASKKSNQTTSVLMLYEDNVPSLDRLHTACIMPPVSIPRRTATRFDRQEPADWNSLGRPYKHTASRGATST
jgi:hypothetical protein